MKVIPNFFIVGAPKCGTTSMYYYLKQHHNVFMPDLKEPHFFSSDLYPPTVIIRDLDGYMNLFCKIKNEKRVGEASASYLYSKIAAKNINKFNPNAKIIILLRNPVDMIYSLHGEFVFTDDELITDFSKALEIEEFRKKGEKSGFREAPEADVLRKKGKLLSSDSLYLYREVADYVPQIERYFKYFNRKNILFILFDELKKSPKKVYRETLEFLELESDFTPDFSIQNENKIQRSRFISRLLHLHYPATINIIKSLIPNNNIRQQILKFVLSINTKTEERLPMDVDLRRQLKKEFKQKNETLSQLIQQDLSFW